MINTDIYEGHTPERWTVDEEDPCRVVDVQDCTIARTDFIDIEEEREWQLANARLIADAPLLLAEVKRLTEFRDKVLAAFVEMPQNKRSLTYLLNEFGYLNHYSHADYLEGLHPHALGLFELKDEWMEKAQQYLESEDE